MKHLRIEKRFGNFLLGFSRSGDWAEVSFQVGVNLQCMQWGCLQLSFLWWRLNIGYADYEHQLDHP
jgi:hypothetical protein